MAFSKSHLYQESARITALIFKTLSHPARQQILQKLLISGSCTVEELLQNHPISISTMSEHLEKLRLMGFITHMEKFPFVIYSIELNNLIKAIEHCLTFFNLFIIPSRK